MKKQMTVILVIVVYFLTIYSAFEFGRNYQAELNCRDHIPCYWAWWEVKKDGY